jgi:hypothetical protein
LTVNEQKGSVVEWICRTANAAVLLWIKIRQRHAYINNVGAVLEEESGAPCTIQTCGKRHTWRRVDENPFAHSSSDPTIS